MVAGIPNADRWRGIVLQYGRFVAVGGLATLSHVALFAYLMETLTLPALLSNGAAFLLAVLVSFFGHFSWTFRERTRHTGLFAARRELWRFFLTALLGLTLNSSIVWSIVDIGGWSYLYALLPMATLVPVLVFLIGRYWVFPEKQHDALQQSAVRD